MSVAIQGDMSLYNEPSGFVDGAGHTGSEEKMVETSLELSEHERSDWRGLVLLGRRLLGPFCDTSFFFVGRVYDGELLRQIPLPEQTFL